MVVNYSIHIEESFYNYKPNSSGISDILATIPTAAITSAITILHC
jgi:hypothetical protein